VRKRSQWPSGLAIRLWSSAQVKVGWCGKAGGVKLANDVDDSARCTRAIFWRLDIKGHVVQPGVD